MINFELQGGKELEKTLAHLGMAAERKIAAQSVRAAAAEFRKQLVKALPRGRQEAQPGEVEGRLKKDIRLHRSIGIRKSGKTTYEVGVVGPARAYAHVQEYGSVNQPPRPVWRPLFESNLKQYLETMGKRAWNKIIEELNRG